MSCIYAGVLSLQIRMRWVIMATVNFSLLIVGLILLKSDCHPAPLLWCERDPTLPWCTSTFALPATRFDCYMMRPRGRPRRGAPWKPRRPSLSHIIVLFLVLEGHVFMSCLALCLHLSSNCSHLIQFRCLFLFP
jgi:hypothetical protein